MNTYEIYVREVNHGYATIEADSEEDARRILFDNWDYVNWVDSEITDIDLEEVK